MDQIEVRDIEAAYKAVGLRDIAEGNRILAISPLRALVPDAVDVASALRTRLAHEVLVRRASERQRLGLAELILESSEELERQLCEDIAQRNSPVVSWALLYARRICRIPARTIAEFINAAAIRSIDGAPRYIRDKERECFYRLLHAFDNQLRTSIASIDPPTSHSKAPFKLHLWHEIEEDAAPQYKPCATLQRHWTGEAVRLVVNGGVTPPQMDALKYAMLHMNRNQPGDWERAMSALRANFGNIIKEQ